MKKFIFNLASGIIFNAFSVSIVVGQSVNNISIPASVNVNTTAFADGVKTAAPNIIDPVDKTTVKEIKANLKAAKAEMRVTSHLNKNFKTVSDLKWRAEENLIVATFKMNAKSARIVYSKSGRWLYSVITYNEDQLPLQIRSLVNANYNGYTITLVQEISQENITMHLVHLEDCSSIKQILVYDNEITVYGAFTKSK